MQNKKAAIVHMNAQSAALVQTVIFTFQDDGLIEAIEKAGELKGYIRKISKNSKTSHIPVKSCTVTSSPRTDKSEILSGTSHGAAGTFQV